MSHCPPLLLALALLSAPLAAQEPRRVHEAAGFRIEVIGDLKGFALDLRTTPIAEGLDVVTLRLRKPVPEPPPRFTLKWSVSTSRRSVVTSKGR